MVEDLLQLCTCAALVRNVGRRLKSSVAVRVIT